MIRSLLLQTLLLALLASPARAQDPEVHPDRGQPPAAQALSIEEAIRIAQGASEDVEIAEAGVQSARGAQISALSAAFPQISASISYQHTFESEYDDAFGSTDTTGDTAPDTGDTGDTGDTPDTGGTGGAGAVPSFSFDLPFGNEDTWRAGFEASQAVFAGGALLAQARLAASSLDVAEISARSAKASAALGAARAYYDAALAERLLGIAEATLAQSEATLQNVKLGHEQKVQADFDLLRAQVQVENQRVAVLRQRRVRDTALMQLKLALDLPPETALTLTTPLESEAPESVAQSAADTAGVKPSAERAPVRQAEEGVEISESALRLTQSQRFPMLGLSASYGWVAYPDDAWPPAPGDDEWKTNFTAGFGLSIPIFNGGRVYGDVMSAQADLTTSRARLQQAREAADLEAADAAAELSTAEAAWRATAGTVDQAQRAYAIAELRFNEGISTQTELADARLLLQQALANRAQAARDLQVARIRVALLPALPLGAGTGSMAASSAPSGQY